MDVEKAKKLIEEYRKHKDECIKEVLDIFEKRKLEPIIAYHMLTSVTRAMEKEDPKLKMARVITEKIVDGARKERGGTEPIPEARLTALARQQNKKWLGGKKATVWACGMKKTRNDIRTKCDECGGVCYRSRDKDTDLLNKDAKKVCLKCVVTNPKYSKDLNEEQKDIMGKGL